MKENPSHKTTAAIYARVSTDEQREGQTIDSQIAELESFAKQQGWLITQIYRDDGWSGSLLMRPQLDQLRDDAGKGLFSALLLNDVDRLARDVTHLGIIKRDLERHGVQLIFRKLPTGQSPTGNLMINILGSFAEFEREMIADRTRRGKRHKVEVRKEYLGSLPPYGYRYLPGAKSQSGRGCLEVEPKEAVIVHALYRWVEEEGLSIRKVVTRLNAQAIPPRKGGRVWGRSSVNRILRNQTYAGVWHFNKHISTEPLRTVRARRYVRSPKSSSRLRPRADWLPVPLPPHLHLIEPTRWQRVQRQLDTNIAFSPRNAKHTYLLGGLVRCASCSARFIGDPGHGRFRYRCLARCQKARSIQEEVLNEIVWTGLKQALLQPELLVSAAIGAQSRRSITTGLTHEQIDRGLDTLKTEESRLLEAYKRGILTPDLLAEELRKVNAQRAAIRARHTIEPSVPQQISPELIRRSLGRLRDLISQELSSWTVEERQRLLRLIIRTVLIEQDKVRIQAQIPIDEGSPDEFLSNQTRVPPTPHFGYGRIAPTSLGEDGRNEASKTTSCAAEFELIFPLPADFQAHKDARTGRFVTAAHAEGHGETTKHVAVRIPKRQ